MAGAGDVAAGDDGDGDEGAGLGAVDPLDEIGGGRLALGLDVDDLAADHAGGQAGGDVGVDLLGGGADAGADGAGDLFEDVDGGDGGAVEPGDGVKGEGLEGVAGEDGDGFAEDLVAGGLAAAEVVVVERGEVVVDEGVGVEHLDGGAELDGGDLGVGVLGAHAPSLKAEDGTEALAAGKDGVAHGAMDGVRGGIGSGQEAFERAIGARGAGVDQVLDGEGHKRSIINERLCVWSCCSGPGLPAERDGGQGEEDAERRGGEGVAGDLVGGGAVGEVDGGGAGGQGNGEQAVGALDTIGEGEAVARDLPGGVVAEG